MIAEECWVEISHKMDLRVKPLENEIKQLHLKMENEYMPRLQTMESVYTSTYERYVNQLEKQDKILDDNDVMKKVLMHHSEQLEAINKTLENHGEQLEAINRTLEDHNRRLDKIEGRLDKIEGRLDKIEGRLDSFENRFDKLTDLVLKNSELIGTLIDVVEKLSQQINVNYN